MAAMTFIKDVCTQPSLYATLQVTWWGDDVTNTSLGRNASDASHEGVEHLLSQFTSLPVTSAAHFGLATGLLLAFVLHVRLPIRSKIDPRATCYLKHLERLSQRVLLSCLSLLLASFLLPLTSLLLLLLASYRRLVHLLLAATLPSYAGLLDGTDAVWALEDDASKSVINVLAMFDVAILEGNYEPRLVQMLRRIVQTRILATPHACPKFWQRRRRSWLGYFYWERQHVVRVEEHIQYMTQEGGGDVTRRDGGCDVTEADLVATDEEYFRNEFYGMSESVLKALVSELANSALPADNTATWEILVGRDPILDDVATAQDTLQDGVATPQDTILDDVATPQGAFEDLKAGIQGRRIRHRRYPVLFRIHHSMGDGVALIRLLLEALADKMAAPDVTLPDTADRWQTCLTTSIEYVSLIPCSKMADKMAAPDVTLPNTATRWLPRTTSIESVSLIPCSTGNNVRDEETLCEARDITKPVDRLQVKDSPSVRVKIAVRSPTKELDDLFAEESTDSSDEDVFKIVDTDWPVTDSFVTIADDVTEKTIYFYRDKDVVSDTYEKLRSYSTPLFLKRDSQDSLTVHKNPTIECLRHEGVTRCLTPLERLERSELPPRCESPLHSSLTRGDSLPRCQSPIPPFYRCESPLHSLAMDDSLPRCESPLQSSLTRGDSLPRCQSPIPPFYRCESPLHSLAMDDSLPRCESPLHSSLTRGDSLPRCQSPIPPFYRCESPLHSLAMDDSLPRCESPIHSLAMDDSLPRCQSPIPTFYRCESPLHSLAMDDSLPRCESPLHSLALDDSLPRCQSPIPPYYRSETPMLRYDSIDENFPPLVNQDSGRESSFVEDVWSTPTLRDYATLPLCYVTGSRAESPVPQIHRKKYDNLWNGATPVSSRPNTPVPRNDNPIPRCNSPFQRSSTPLFVNPNAVPRCVSPLLNRNQPYAGRRASEPGNCSPLTGRHIPASDELPSYSNVRQRLSTTKEVDLKASNSEALPIVAAFDKETSEKSKFPSVDEGVTSSKLQNRYARVLSVMNHRPEVVECVFNFLNRALTLLSAPATLINKTLIRAADVNPLHGAPLSGRKVVAWHFDPHDPHTPANLLDTIRRVKRRVDDVTFTDVFLTALSDSLEAYFLGVGCDVVPAAVTVAMPARMRDEDVDVGEGGLPKMDNRFSVALLTLPIAPAAGTGQVSYSPLQRLAAVSVQTAVLRASPDYQLNYWLMAVVSKYLPVPLLAPVLNNVHSSLVVSNLVGPPVDVHLGGYHLTDMAFWVPTRATTGVGVSVLSYAGRLQLGISADDALITCQQDADVILDGVVAAIRRLDAITS